MANKELRRNLLQKFKEALVSVLPVTIIILIVGLSVDAMPGLNFASLAVGAVLLIIGMFLYTIGSDVAVEPIGGYIGSKTTETGKVWAILLVCFIVGVIVTVAEPDLNVLASQISSIPKMVLIIVVGVGVGLFMLIAVLRIVLKIPLNILLIVSYAIVFLLAGLVSKFVGDEYVPLAFDSGGVTTGPITVPFILTLCVGVSAVAGNGSKGSEDNSFGMVGVCSIGPVIAVLALGLIYKSKPVAEAATIMSYETFGDVLMSYITAFPTYLKEVGIALAPIAVFFLVYDLVLLHLPFKRMLRIFTGLLYTYLGLTIFLTSANVGFMSAGAALGSKLASINPWLVVPVGAVVGAAIVLAEPAVHVLNRQVEEITGGVISSKTMLVVLSSSMAVAVGLAMVRVASGISIWWFLAPGYAIALILSFFVPKLFTAIAFDSGGVASGPMTATFLLPFAMGGVSALGGNILTDAFGTVAFVAMTPLIALQIFGMIYKIKSEKKNAVATKEHARLLAEEGNIIELM